MRTQMNGYTVLKMQGRMIQIEGQVAVTEDEFARLCAMSPKPKVTELKAAVATLRNENIDG